MLGTINTLKLRDVWESEPKDFNKFIAENLDLVGEKLGCSLELVEREHNPCSDNKRSIDILAKRSDNGELVVIELQYGSADTSHCWRLLSYASAKRAKYVVLICEALDDFFATTFERLNEDSNETDYFVLTASVFKIDDSKPAFELHYAVKPNEAIESVNPASPSRLPYWEGFKDYYAQNNSVGITADNILRARDDDHLNLYSLRQDRWFTACSHQTLSGIKIAVHQKNAELYALLESMEEEFKSLVPEVEFKLSKGVYLILYWTKPMRSYENPQEAYQWLTATADTVFNQVVKPYILT